MDIATTVCAAITRTITTIKNSTTTHTQPKVSHFLIVCQVYTHSEIIVTLVGHRLTYFGEEK